MFALDVYYVFIVIPQGLTNYNLFPSLPCSFSLDYNNVIHNFGQV